MYYFTFLDIQHISGKNKLDIFEKIDEKCVITDFSILLGGYGYNNGGDIKKNITGKWWSRTSNFDDVKGFLHSGFQESFRAYSRHVGARPAIEYSVIKSVCSNEVIQDNGIKEVEYGEYPQTIVSENYSYELEMAYNQKSLRATGRYYTTDSVHWDKHDISFKARTHAEYEYDGKKYIRFVGDSNCKDAIVSDGRTIELKKPYWVHVEPIIWLIDEKADKAFSKKLIFSGVQFCNRGYYNRSFGSTDIKFFMDYFFSKEIVPNNVYSQTLPAGQSHNINEIPFQNINEIPSIDEGTQYIEEKGPIRKKNPYGFNFNKVSEEDIIRGAVESNVSVFLHGRSSDGKSARVKQLDPDCEIIYMRNATPDSLNGKSVYNSTTGEMIDIPPTWYSRVKERCEAEPDKIHIVFFDELTNALPSIQGMAFNIVLDGEVNGKWKLPPNARIVAAGNDLNDSLAANQMAEPLFNRFAHVYIDTTVDSWLKWASTPKEKYEKIDYKEEELESKICPSVYAYVAYKSYTGYDVLRTPYTGDKPNADPRKWEMASRLLQKTKQPEMLRALIGEELTIDFTAFARKQVISVEDVINHNYSLRDLEMDVSQKFATAVGLSSVDEEHFEIVRNFMKLIGAEPRAAFDSMWAHGDEKRLEKLAEVQMADRLSRGGLGR